ncbi:unnamed protein product [Fraxinus pennsylvanica]|uniref:Pentatricopeptide repeat-containing protein n=1 Tax=Fraxinus pennsylvanica TaxID=56036 RepID=A0AAD2ED65_9LAMI|nr:unnamed protein product [Fraxinus pennsylvanica]
MDAAFRIFHEMPRRGYSPDSYTYGTLINGLCRAGRIWEAIELLVEMEAIDCSPTLVTYSLLIHGLCQSNYLEAAIDLLKKIRSKGIEPNVYTYSSIMNGLCKNGDGNHNGAVEVLDRMKVQGLKPDARIVQGLCAEDNLNCAFQLDTSVRSRRISVESNTFESLVHCACKKGDRPSPSCSYY